MSTRIIPKPHFSPQFLPGAPFFLPWYTQGPWMALAGLVSASVGAGAAYASGAPYTVALVAAYIGGTAAICLFTAFVMRALRKGDPREAVWPPACDRVAKQILLDWSATSKEVQWGTMHEALAIWGWAPHGPILREMIARGDGWATSYIPNDPVHVPWTSRGRRWALGPDGQRDLCSVRTRAVFAQWSAHTRLALAAEVRCTP